MKNILLLLSGAMCASGCAATLTPNGDVYTELLAPTSTVIVEERLVYPVVVQAPRPVIRPPHRPVVRRPIAPAPRYAKYPGPRVSHKPNGPKVTPHHGQSSPKGKPGPGKPQGKPGPQGNRSSHGSHGPHGR